ncbi:MAG: DNA polymerase IV [Chloroflexi bacterium]|nr:DNA polymerase IV [Chloroflexota bacterium]
MRTSVPHHGRRILHIDLDAFFVAVERARNPSLRGKPVAVGGEAGSRGVVACASYEARRYGLKAGMPIALAMKLCPDCIFIPGAFERYAQASACFHRILRDFTPDVEPLSLDEAFLDLTGFEPHYGPAAEAATRIKARIVRELDVTASVGIATGKTVAKVASDRCKPDGLLEVPPGQEAAFLAPLPLDDLPGLGDTTANALRGLGVATLGQLAAMPAPVLRQRLGWYGLLLSEWAKGRDSRPVLPPAPQKSFSRETTFPQDVADRDLLRATLRYLTERVAAALRAEGKEARCVALKLRYADFTTISRQHALRHPSASDDALFQAGMALLGQALGKRWDKVRLIGVGAADLVPADLQLSLFPTSRDRELSLYRAVDRLRARYGFLAVQTGLTQRLGRLYPQENEDYRLKTSALSR